MSRHLLIGAACALTTALAAPVAAQTAEGASLRRLDWAGRPDASGPTALRRAAPVIPHAGVQTTRVALRPAQPWRPTQGQAGGRPSLTPATAFASPAPDYVPAYAPPDRALPAPPPAPTATPEPRRQPPPRTAAPAPRPAVTETRPASPAQPVLQPQPQPQPQPAPPPELRPVAQAPQPDAVVDPMAPRPDAPIFRIQAQRAAPTPQPAPQPAPAPPVEVEPQPAPARAQPAAAQPQPQPAYQAPPQQQGARYYSVHRQAGRTPDRTVLPEPVWLDRMPVELDSTPQSEDLAAPPETPQMVRDSQGRMRPVQAPQTDDMP